MQKKSWIKYLSIIMFAAVLALIGSASISYAADENPVEETPVVENECDGFSCVEENGVFLSSENDVFYSTIKGTKEFKIKLYTKDSNIVINNAYYMTKTNSLQRIVDPNGTPTVSVEFTFLAYTEFVENELIVYYTTTAEPTEEKSISLLFFKDVNAPVVNELTIKEEGTVSYNNYYKEISLVTSASETGLVQSGIASVKYYSIDDSVKSAETELTEYDLDNIELKLSNLTGTKSTLCVVVTDNTGLSTEQCSEEYTFDNNGPEITLTPDDDKDETMKTHTVLVSVNDPKTGVKNIERAWVKFDSLKTEEEFNNIMASYDLNTLTYEKIDSEQQILTPAADNNNETIYVLVVRSEDNLGNVSYSYSCQLSVLATATKYLISVDENLSIATPSHRAYLSIESKELAVVEEIVYAWAEVANGYPITFDELKAAIDNGTYTVYGTIQKTAETKYEIYAEGLNGKYVLLVGVKTTTNSNVITSIEHGIDVFMFDNTAPNIMVNPDGSEEVGKKYYDVEVTVNEANFKNEVYYVLLEQELDTITADEIKQLGTMITVESKIFNISLGKDVEPALNGKYYLYILVSDDAGNNIITSKAFLFDNSLPVVEVVVEDRFYANTEEIAVVLDDESEITSYEYAWVKADTEIDLSKIVFEVVAENKIPTSLILADGEYKLIVKVTDEAGNVSEVYVSEVFKFDVSSPVVTGVENNGYYKGLVKIEVKDVNEVTLMLNGTEIENGTELATSGFYSLIVVDALGNEVVVNFVINTTGKSTINNKSVKVERQQYAPIKCDEEGRCSIEVARGTYTKDSVIVLTKGTEDGYVMLDQDTNHVSISKDLKSTLSIRKYQLEVADETVISQEADANGYYGYVNLHVVTFESAVKLGVEKTVIDNEAVTLTLGLTGSFALVGIYFITRGKKQRI